MLQHARFCVVPDLTHALWLHERCRDQGLAGVSASLVMSKDRLGSDRVLIEQGTLAKLLGPLSTIMAFPVMGPLAVVGGLLEPLRAAALRATVGGFTGALVRLGLTTPDAIRSAAGVRDGGILLVIDFVDETQAQLVDAVIAAFGLRPLKPEQAP